VHQIDSDARRGGDRPLARPGFAFATLIVEDLKAVVSHLAARGFPARQIPYELRQGVWMALVDDPDGNVVELVSYNDLLEYRPELTRIRSADGYDDVTE
jgi:hypothetical protein